jgi:S1-C subfamily serine protease
MFKKIFIVFLISLNITLVNATEESIEVVVNGLHNGETRIIGDGDVLFSDDSFNLEVSSYSGQHFYIFLLDSSGKIIALNDFRKSFELLKGDKIIFPGIDKWYKLDDTVGVETVFVLGSDKIYSLEYLEKNLAANRLSFLKDRGITIATTKINHMARDFIKRGSTILAASVELKTSLVTENQDDIFFGIQRYLVDSVVAPKLINEILRYSKGISQENTLTTRGIKEINLFKKVAPSVVLILTKEGALGSGFLISDDGLVITNWHVIEGNKPIQVAFMPPKLELKKEDFLKAVVVKGDEVSDLALLKLESMPLNVRPLSLNVSDAIEIGQDVHAIGHPKGEFWTYTNGIVSQLRGNYTWNKTHHAKLIIQTQTPINPGNSGGPLLNDDGEIVGVNSFILPNTQGINYAVSSEDIRIFLESKNIWKEKLMSKEEELSKGLNLNILNIDERDIDGDGSEELVVYVDKNKNKKADHLIVYKGKEIITIIIDRDEDGNWDEIIVDSDSNGSLDKHFYDLDGDGVEEMIGYDENEDGYVDRYTKA